MARFHVPFFRIFYSTTYTSLYIIQLILLAITPASLIYSAINAVALQYIFIIGGVYILTALLVLVIYSSRLYTNRTVLAAVGKSWIPVEEGEVNKSVRKLVKSQLDRSALIALECRPRNLAEDGLSLRVSNGPHRDGSLTTDQSAPEARLIGRLVKVDPQFPPWGMVQHPGWSSPNAQETALSPQIYFTQIISELPNLLEARMVSLGGEPRAISESTQPLDKSQQTPISGLREYLERLDVAGVVVMPDCAEEFIEKYEHARFCGRPLSERDFVALTSVFAELLSGLQPSPKVNGPRQYESRGLLHRRISSSSMESFSGAPRNIDTEVGVLVEPAYTTPRPRHIRVGSVLTTTWTNDTHASRLASRRSSNASFQSALSVIQLARGDRPP